MEKNIRIFDLSVLVQKSKVFKYRIGTTYHVCSNTTHSYHRMWSYTAWRYAVFNDSHINHEKRRNYFYARRNV